MPLGEGWALGSGLLENENVYIQSAQFNFDAGYNNGQSVCLILNVQCDDGRLEKLLLPVGDGWEPGPGGAEVRREDGNTTRPIQKQSAYGQWVESIKTIAESDPNCMAVLEQRPNVKQAATWLGLGFHVNRKEETYKMKDRATGEMIERTTQRLIADQFLGVIGQPAANVPPVAPVAPPVPAPAVPAPATPAPAAPVGVVAPVAAPGVQPVIGPPPAPVAPVAPPVAPVGQPAVATAAPETIQALTQIAKTVPDHNTWMLQAFNVPGVMGNGALEAGITDQSDAGLFLRLRTS